MSFPPTVRSPAFALASTTAEVHTGPGTPPATAQRSPPGAPPSRARSDPGPFRGPQREPALAERLREHLLLGRRQVDAAFGAQLRVRVVRPGRADHGRQAAPGPVATGGEREAVRLLGAQPAAARGDRRRALGRAALPRDVLPVRPVRRTRRCSRAGGLPVVRRRLARQRRRPASDPAADPRLRRGSAGGRNGPLAHSSVVRRAGGSGVQHEDPRGLSDRPGDSARLRGVRARLDTPAGDAVAHRRRC